MFVCIKETLKDAEIASPVHFARDKAPVRVKSGREFTAVKRDRVFERSDINCAVVRERGSRKRFKPLHIDVDPIVRIEEELIAFADDPIGVVFSRFGERFPKAPKLRIQSVAELGVLAIIP